jgi:hypothetical protein
MEDSTVMSWRKSSYSGNGGGNCIEVGQVVRNVVVRDTKDREGAVLAFGADAWADFLTTIWRSLGRLTAKPLA